MANKLIRGIDEDTWRKFTGLCKMEAVSPGDELTKILKAYIKRRYVKV